MQVTQPEIQGRLQTAKQLQACGGNKATSPNGKMSEISKCKFNNNTYN